MIFDDECCLWKVVSEIDNTKRKQGIEEITLREDKPCYTCAGEPTDRKCYVRYGDLKEE